MGINAESQQNTIKLSFFATTSGGLQACRLDHNSCRPVIFLGSLREDIGRARGYNAAFDLGGLDDFSSRYLHSLERVTSLEGYQ